MSELAFPSGYAIRVTLPVDGSKIQGKLFPSKGRLVFYRKPYGHPEWHRKTNSPIAFSSPVVTHLVHAGVKDVYIDIPQQFGRRLYTVAMGTLLRYGVAEYVPAKDIENWNLDFEHYTAVKGHFGVPFLPDAAVVNVDINDSRTAQELREAFFALEEAA